MATKNDNSEKEMIAEEVHYSSSGSSWSEESVDATDPLPASSTPTSNPTAEEGSEDQREDVAIVATALDAATIDVDTSGEAQNVQAVRLCVDQISAEKIKGKRMEVPEASSVEGDQKKPRKIGEFFTIPEVPPKCYKCGKLFKSWEAVFSHLGVHINIEGVRERREILSWVSGESSSAAAKCGAADDVPREVLQEHLAPTLLNIAHQVLSASDSLRTDGSDIDMNKTIQADDQEAAGHQRRGRFDLNKPPPPEDEDDDQDKDVDSAAK